MTALTDAIDAATSDPSLRLALRLGALLEGGSLSGPWAPGDQGTSFGPYQIHLPAHPDMTQAGAEDPATAVLYMLPAYEAARRQVGDITAAADPALAAAQLVYLAERPAQMYPTSRIRAAWAQLADGGGAPAPGGTAPPMPGGTVPGLTPVGLPNPLDALAPLWAALTDRGTQVRIVLVLVGLALAVGGAVLALSAPAGAAVGALA